MKTSDIYSSFTGSLFLHILIISAAILMARLPDSNPPAPYMVSLVDFPSPHIPAPFSRDDENKQIQKQIEKPDIEIPTTAHKQTTKASIPEKQAKAPVEPSLEAHKQIDKKTIPVKQTKKPMKPPQAQAQAQAKDRSKEEQRFIRDTIEALEAMKRLEAIREIEKIAKLRKVVDIEGQKVKIANGRPSAMQVDRGGSRDKPSNSEDYQLTVVDKIRQQWVFPESIDKDLEAIVSIRIIVDGSVIISKMEKSSGNPLFDRSVLRAINKASPLPPPPHEMELGARFRP